tara:strand:+ start:34 stop:288 length:255 start_codon:yes stop_codon:yes gene_type:complete
MSEFDSSLITVRSKDCFNEYQRQYKHLKKYPNSKKIPPPSQHIIKREIKKLKKMTNPPRSIRITTPREFKQARNQLKKILGYTS